MSDETQVAGQQAPTGVDILEQRERAEHGTGRRNRKGKPEPGALPDRRQVANVQTHRVALALDEPATNVGEVG